MKKILIAITDAGNAHKISAEALQISFKENFPNQYKIKIVDFLKEADVEPFNTSETSYTLVSKNTFLDNLNIFVSEIINYSVPYNLFKSYANNRLKNSFTEIINSYKPDLIICNHPVPAMVLSEIKHEIGGFKYVITMLDLVTFFISMGDINADLIFTPTEYVVPRLLSLGVQKQKIRSGLFPFHPKLKKIKKRESVFKNLGFNINKPVILITGGGLGLKTLKEAIIKLGERDDLQLLVITGRLTYLKEELEQLFIEKKNIKILGFVDNMQDYFSIADIVVGKPGATTIMESELFNKKAIFTKRVGHVEMEHEKYVSLNPNFRYIGNNWKILEKTVDELLRFEITDTIRKRSFDEIDKMVKEMNDLFQVSN